MKKIIYSVFSSLFFAISFMFLFSINTRAYIDPSVMTYAIQAIAGIAIVIATAFGIYFRKIKKKINKKFEIDENKNKEVETDDIIMNQDKNNS